MSLKRSRVPFAARLSPVVLALAIGGLAQAAHAEDLVELYNAARAFDATYLSARAAAEAAEYRVAQQDSLKLPKANISAGVSRAEATSPTTVSIGGQTRVVRVDSSPTVGTTTIAASQPLFNRVNDVTVEQAHRQLESAKATLDAAEQDLVVRVAQAYFDVLAAEDSLASARAAKTAIGEQLASAKRNFEVGTATITDTREAQARYDLSTAQELAADNDLRAKRIALDQLVGRANVKPTPLSAPQAVPTMSTGDLDQWVDTADKQNPRVRIARVDLDVAQLDTEKARAQRLPTVDLGAQLKSDYTRNYGNSNSTGVSVTLAMPLFTGFAIQNRIKETLVLEQQKREDLEAARRATAQTTRVTYFALQSGQAQVKALEAAEASSKLALEATQLGYKVGVRVNLDVLNAQTQLFQTQRDLAKARYDAVVAGLKLRQVTGTLKPDDLTAVNTLLIRK